MRERLARTPGSLSSALTPYVPWADGTGARWRGWRRLPLMAPFSLGYLVLSWALFIPLTEPGPQGYWVDDQTLRRFAYHIGDLTEDPVRFFRSLLTAPFLNHDDVQLIYVTVLLLVFGVVFESREGARRTAAIFFGATLSGALAAGVLLHILYPEVLAGEFFDYAWNRTWSGGSAGAFGVMGALAGRARRPWPLLALFAAWEAGVALLYLKQYTSAFHITALLVGFVATRKWLPPTLSRSR